MNLVNPSIFMAVVYLSFGFEGSGAEAEEIGDPGSQFAAHIEELLANMTETKYQGLTEIDEETGSLKCDCSGLIGHMLRHHFPEAYVSLDGEEAPWRKRPVAVTFYETFVVAEDDANLEGPWERVREMMDVRPGDILAWRKVTVEQGDSSGHVLMIAGFPEEERDDRIRVRVIDSTRGVHANDTRAEGILGVGAGDMWFTVDRDGEPNGFYVNEKSRLNTVSKVAIGRIVEAGVADISENQLDSEDLDYIRMKESAAMDLAKERGLESRVIVNDGEIFPVKMGLTNERVNFVIKRGRVVRVVRG